MVDTVSAEKLEREEAAERLRELADELESGDASTVRAGNKTVELRPPSPIAYEVSVRERSSILRGQRESVTIKMDWRPSNVSEAGDAAGAEAE
ncbi:amphi-Trp domain-containing protein [Halopiger xanaduensis]|uniref:Amphi-Trp domain-containing protein n=1 Tax=Halopiger xanaduensis (strain DSM 18323 / JCM 14033 / SH-6) TaxID=797210 RepID=F8D5K8_HALXS|nr:amphi-Trp domain-containing protein [Halopiger xanaduensis]AEH38844.1 hypothetical protein Halxa_4242 [Halopiger xanaduensis SH-6]